MAAWTELLEDYKNKVVNEEDKENYDISEHVIKSEKLAAISENDDVTGEGATDEAIAATEARLGLELPPSYKEFLKYSNGLLWRENPLHLLPVEDIDFLRHLDPDSYDFLKGEGMEFMEDLEPDFSMNCEELEDVEDRTVFPTLVIPDADSLIQISINDYYTIVMNPKRTYGKEWEVYNLTWEPDEMYAHPSFEVFLMNELKIWMEDS